MLKKLSILVFLMVVLAASPLFAQNSSTHSVTVTLQDATNDEPVGFATVSVTLKGSDTPAKYTITNEKGSATLDGLKNGTYIFAAELMGYKKYTQEITVKDGNVAIGTVKMDVDQETLDAANVSAIGNPVIIKKDTIEYTAAAFKTTENDVLEDLLKKLPGVEVDNGTVTVNGQTVTRVYIDGKTFFMDDPQLATKNIPAKIINKVKVVQKKSEQAEFTGIDDGQEETVLDLSVQPGMMNGLMGNLQAGLGHDLPKPEDKTAYNDDYRFNSQLFLGNFTGNTQISIIGNANNANNRGFGDRMGGGGGGGITTSYMIGANVGDNFFDDKMEATADYMFSGSNSESMSEQYNETVIKGADYRLAQENNSTSNRNNYDNRIGMRIEHEFSKSANIIFEPQINETDRLGRYDVLAIAGVSAMDPTTRKRIDAWAANGGALVEFREKTPTSEMVARVLAAAAKKGVNPCCEVLDAIKDGGSSAVSIEVTPAHRGKLDAYMVTSRAPTLSVVRFRPAPLADTKNPVLVRLFTRPDGKTVDGADRRVRNLVSHRQPLKPDKDGYYTLVLADGSHFYVYGEMTDVLARYPRTKDVVWETEQTAAEALAQGKAAIVREKEERAARMPVFDVDPNRMAFVRLNEFANVQNPGFETPWGVTDWRGMRFDFIRFDQNGFKDVIRASKPVKGIAVDGRAAFVYFCHTEAPSKKTDILRKKRSW